MRFTAEDAFEASETGEPIMITRAAAAAILEDHGATLEDFSADNLRLVSAGAADIDAALVLAWLGY